MLRTYTVFFVDHPSIRVKAASAANARNIAAREQPVGRIARCLLDEDQTVVSASVSKAAPAHTVIARLSQTEAEALWRVQAATGETVSAIVRRAILAEDQKVRAV